MTTNQIDKRLLYFNGQFLQEPDFTDEQNYHVDRLQRHTMYLHTPGIADGLEVTGADRGATTVAVEKGVAIDAAGRAIYLDQNRDNIPLDAPENKGKIVLIVISYEEVEQEIKIKGLDPRQANRIAEVPKIEVVIDDKGRLLPTHIPLTRLHLDAEGKIDEPVAGAKPQDDSVRKYAGTNLPSEVALNKASLNTISLSRPGDNEGWPELTSSARGVVDVKGDVKVTGRINNRDVAADGKKLDDHLGANGNPHRTTATDIDSQGGTNQIVARINAGSGTINRERIATSVGAVGWVRLPFQPAALAGKTPFTLNIGRATATSTGAEGIVEIPIPPPAARVRGIRIAGTANNGRLQITLYRTGWNTTTNKPIINTLINNTITSPSFSDALFMDQPLDPQLNSLVLHVSASGEVEIWFVGVQFE